MIRCLPVRGFMEVNCYLWGDEETRHGFLIDPGARGEDLLDCCEDQGWVIEKILLTHGHFDHIGGIAAIRKKKEIPVLIHEAGLCFLADPRLNLSAFFGGPFTVPDALSFRDGARFSLESNPAFTLQVIHTPGHTPDSVLFYDEPRKEALTGDTIFLGSRGNDRFPGGNGELLLRSIRERVLTLPEDTRLYSGHSDPTTVRAEKPLYLPI